MRTLARVPAVGAAGAVTPVSVVVAEAATEATKERFAVADREDRLRLSLRWGGKKREQMLPERRRQTKHFDKGYL